MTENVFRFQSIRLPSKQTSENSASRIDTGVWLEEDELVVKCSNAMKSKASRDNIRKIASEFLEAGKSAQEEALPSISSLFDWAVQHADRKLSDIDLSMELNTVLGQPPSAFIERRAVRAGAKAIAGRYLAANILSEPKKAGDVAMQLKLLHLLREAAADRMPHNSSTTLGDYLSRLILVLPKGVGPMPRPATKAADVPDQTSQVPNQREYLQNLGAAHDAITAMLSNPGLRLSKRAAKESEEVNSEDASHSEAVHSGSIEAIVLNKEILSSLPERSLAALKTIVSNLEDADPFATIADLETKIGQVAGALAANTPAAVFLRLGDTLMDPDDLAGAYGSIAFSTAGKDLPEGSAFLPAPEDVRCMPRAYIDDLLIVKQTLKSYELAEFAHVENVMAGETRSREHRRLDLSEEVTTTETEKEVESERDLQSTDRNEIQSEAEKKIKDDMKLEAGLQVSGSYGPAISFQADAKASFSSSSEESVKKASRYSREVTEKAAERTRERIRTERRKRKLQEIEETNQHGFVGSDDKHTRGIYRWLNKKYEAQIFEYGQRMMLEFILPEPAAYYIYSLIENPPLEMAAPKPPKFKGQPLKPENITRINYQDYVAAYQVRNVTPPPSTFKMKSVFEKQDGKEKGDFGRATKITIPPEYEAVCAQVSVSAARKWEIIGWSGDYSIPAGTDLSTPHDQLSEVVLMVGDQHYTMKVLKTGRYMVFGNPGPRAPWRGEISIGFHAMNATSFSMSVDVMCQLNDVGRKQWQHETYEAIMDAYLAQKSEYDEAQTAQSFEGVQIKGRNPLINRQIEKDEIKKLVVMSLLNDPMLDLNPFRAGAEPIVDPLLACGNESLIRFFEHSFEWTNMLYVLYPYFWGRRKRWQTLMSLTDTDSDFAAFLKAGAVRVQLPVRPDFKEIVANFCQTGDLYLDADAGLYEDDVYFPIIEEITEKLGKPGEEKPYGKDPEKWEVTVPTTLVVVQDLEEIPGIKDCLTDTDMKLVP